MDKQPELLRQAEISRRLGVSPSVIQYWRLKRAIKPVTTIPVPKYDLEAVRAFLREYYIPRTPKPEL